MTTPSRKLRCRVLNKLGNRCPSEELTDAGFCLKHLQKAHAEYQQILTDAGIIRAVNRGDDAH